MNLWKKIKLLWKGRSIVENAMKIKSKWKEPTFWIALLSQVGTVVGYLKGVLDPRAAIVLNAVTGAAYNYVRGLEKAQTDGVKPYKNSSEFWIGLAGMANNAMLAVQAEGLNPAWLMTTSVVLGHAVTTARDLANMRPQEAVARADQ